MQVNASIDESDVGRMRPGQAVTFRVDAYPAETFHGNVRQVRLNPVTVQNVVTYSTVIDVPNPELKLKPGMTASVTIEIARRENALRVPSAAIRFRPTADVFASLKQTVPPDLERGFGRGNRGPGGGSGGRSNAGAPGASGASGTPAAGAPAAGQPQANAQPRGQNSGGTGKNASAQGQQARAEQGQSGGRGGFGGGQAGPGGPGGPGGQGGPGGGRFANMTPEERQKAMEERMKNMTPEERAAFEERRKQRVATGGGFGPGGPGGGGGRGNAGGGQGTGNFQRGNTGGGQGNFQRGGGGSSGGQGGFNRGGNAPRNADSSKAAATTSATTIDALFAPLQPVETRGRVWLFVGKQLKPVDLRLGITDGTYTEVLNDPSELAANTEVVISIITPEMASRPAGQQGNQANNPLMPQRGRGPGQGPGGGGGGRGGGR
jgi:hypothetical protein